MLYIISSDADAWSLTIPNKIAKKFTYFRNALISDDTDAIEARIQWPLEVAQVLVRCIEEKMPNADCDGIPFWVDLMFIMNFLGVEHDMHTQLVRSFATNIIRILRKRDRHWIAKMSDTLDRLPMEWFDELISPENFNPRYFPFLALCTGKIRECAFARKVLVIERLIGLNTRAEWNELGKLASQFPKGFKVNLVAPLSELTQHCEYGNLEITHRYENFKTRSKNLNSAEHAAIFEPKLNRMRTIGARWFSKSMTGLFTILLNQPVLDTWNEYREQLKSKTMDYDQVVDGFLPSSIGKIVAYHTKDFVPDKMKEFLMSPLGINISCLDIRHIKDAKGLGRFIVDVVRARKIRPMIIDLKETGSGYDPIFKIRIGDLETGKSILFITGVGYDHPSSIGFLSLCVQMPVERITITAIPPVTISIISEYFRLRHSDLPIPTFVIDSDLNAPDLFKQINIPDFKNHFARAVPSSALGYSFQ